MGFLISISDDIHARGLLCIERQFCLFFPLPISLLFFFFRRAHSITPPFQHYPFPALLPFLPTGLNTSNHTVFPLTNACSFPLTRPTQRKKQRSLQPPLGLGASSFPSRRKFPAAIGPPQEALPHNLSFSSIQPILCKPLRPSPTLWTSPPISPGELYFYSQVVFCVSLHTVCETLSVEGQSGPPLNVASRCF